MFPNCKSKAQFTIYLTYVLEMHSHFQYWHPLPGLSFFGSHLRKYSIWYGRYPSRQSAITGTGRDSFRTISGTGLCHFRYGHSLGPVPKLGSMRMVPFPGRGSASSGRVIHWAPYRNWAPCVWSHFRYGALPVPVRSFTWGGTDKNAFFLTVPKLIMSCPTCLASSQ